MSDSPKIALRDPRPTKVLELPSLKGSKVEIWPSLLVRDLTGFDPSAAPSKQGLAMLPLYIKSWNLSAEDGSDMPISAETVGLLSIEDGTFLMAEVAKFAEGQKKS